MDDHLRVPTVRMDNASLPSDRQFQEWAAHTPYTRLTATRPGAFLARGALWDLNAVHVTCAELDPFVATRDRQMIEADQADHIHVVILQRGSVRMETSASCDECRAPDVFIRDFSLPSRIEASRITCMTVYLPRDFLREVSGSVIPHGRLSPSPQLSILREAVAVIVRHLPQSSAASAGFYARSLRDLVAAAILGDLNGPAAEPDIAMSAAAKAYIAGVASGTLSVDAMMRALGMSRSVLYRLFKRDGGVIAYDRKRRLRAVHRDLSDLSLHKSVREVGAAHGFPDPAALSRLFRHTFGCSPTELRRRASAAPQAPSGFAAEAIRAAIARLA